MKYEVTVKLINRSGLHARPAAIFVQTARKFKSTIRVRLGDKVVDAKNILKILSLGADYGAIITIEAEGEDAEDAIKTLKELIESGLGEES